MGETQAVVLDKIEFGTLEKSSMVAPCDIETLWRLDKVPKRAISNFFICLIRPEENKTAKKRMRKLKIKIYK